MTDPACDFYCGKILSGLLDVPVCFENERVFAFHHTNPIWENHVVLLPRKHTESLLTLEEACERYKLSIEEFLSWQRLIDAHGLAGLRVTRLQDYRSARAR